MALKEEQRERLTEHEQRIVESWRTRRAAIRRIGRGGSYNDQPGIKEADDFLREHDPAPYAVVGREIYERTGIK